MTSFSKSNAALAGQGRSARVLVSVAAPQPVTAPSGRALDANAGAGPPVARKSLQLQGRYLA